MIMTVVMMVATIVNVVMEHMFMIAMVTIRITMVTIAVSSRYPGDDADKHRHHEYCDDIDHDH